MTQAHNEKKFLEFLANDIESNQVKAINRFILQKIDLLITEVEFGDLNSPLEDD